MKLFFTILFPATMCFAQNGVGINTTNPQGVFHVDPLKNNPSSGNITLSQSKDDFIITEKGAVGIGTHLPDASSILDIQSSNKGLLVPRIALTDRLDATTITSPSKGLIIYNTTNDVTKDIREGLAVNTGAPSAPIWEYIQTKEASKYSLENIFTEQAKNSVYFPVTGTSTNNTNNLFDFSVEIPPNSIDAKLIINYNIPGGPADEVVKPSAYIGTIISKSIDGGSTYTNVTGGSKIPLKVLPSDLLNIEIINGQIIDTVSNPSNVPLVVHYRFNAYVEQFVSSSTPVYYRFNIINEQDNSWGVGAITAQLYLK
ncbi:hypothetical protein [Chryseobacterium nematophagum]|nr:hypothetical protein [Chryseobacterium nematophagum]